MEINKLKQILKEERFGLCIDIKKAERELLEEFVNGKQLDISEENFYIKLDLFSGLTEEKIKYITPEGTIIIEDGAGVQIKTNEYDWLPFEVTSLLECLNYEEPFDDNNLG